MSETFASDFERDRILSLESYRILDSLPEKEYDIITRLAAYSCKKPISIITFIDLDSQFIKSHLGMNTGKSRREDSICQLTIQENNLLEINDTLLDPRTANLPVVLQAPNPRFYAGAPLISPEGFILGSLCVMDVVPGKLDEDQKQALSDLASQVVSHLEARKKNIELNTLITKYEEISTMFNNSAELQTIIDRNGTILVLNKSVEKLLGYTREESEGRSMWEFFLEEDIKSTIPILSEGLSSGKKNFEIEARIKLKNGGTKWMGWSLAVKNDKWYVNGRDISEQKLMIAELRQLSLVADSVNNGVVISIKFRRTG